MSGLDAKPLWLVAPIALSIGVASLPIYIGAAAKAEWATVWAGEAALIALLTLFAAASAAFFAYSQLLTTRALDKTSRTFEVINSTQIVDAFRRMDNILAGSRDFMDAKQKVYYYLEKSRARINQDLPLGAESEEAINYSTIVDAWADLSRLYVKDFLDHDLLVQSRALQIARVAYALEPLIRISILSGYHDRNIVTLTNDCVDNLRKRTAFVTVEPWFRTWRLSP